LRKSRSSRKSNYAVPGLYLYDNEVVAIAKEPEAVGARRIGDHGGERGVFQAAGSCGCSNWRAGLRGWTPARAAVCTRRAAYVQTIEKRQGIKIGCPEEAAFRQGFVTLAQLETMVENAQLRIPGRIWSKRWRRGETAD
jgi:glucose-1-phosphate thymidylyltransferase